jgi:hypothetical protein
MLKEYNKVSQEKSAQGKRRWFNSKNLDLIVWYKSDDKSILGFQLCFNLDQDEYAFTWKEEQGADLSKVDSGESFGPYKNLSPTLTEGEKTPYEKFIKIFKENSENLEEEISSLVLEKLQAQNE